MCIYMYKWDVDAVGGLERNGVGYMSGCRGIRIDATMCALDGVGSSGHDSMDA